MNSEYGNVVVNLGLVPLCNAFSNPYNITAFLFLELDVSVKHSKMELLLKCERIHLNLEQKSNNLSNRHTVHVIPLCPPCPPPPPPQKKMTKGNFFSVKISMLSLAQYYLFLSGEIFSSCLTSDNAFSLTCLIAVNPSI